MSTFIGVISNPEFWVSVFYGFIISLILAYIIQDVCSMWTEDTTEYCFTGEKLSIGCTVYDIISETIGIYCGTYLKNDTLCGVVITMEDNTVYCNYPELVNLITVEEQE